MPGRSPRVAQKTTVQLIDDLDGRQANETIRFGLDGATYEIDLSKKNAARLRDALAEYVRAGRRLPGGRRGGRPKATTVGASSRTIRKWARAKGLKVTDRGRIPASVVEQFNAEH
jgi:hypothetical protein